MSTIRLGINGMGRIGRTVIRELLKLKEAGQFQNVEIVAVNNPTKQPESFARLMKYDSLHGTLKEKVFFQDNHLHIGEYKIYFATEFEPENIPWAEHQVDIVLDATGVFKDMKGLSRHLNDSVKKVIMCAPGTDLDGTFVFGINHESYDPSNHHVVSNASCTTNCLAPVAKVLQDNFGIVSGLMTTVHAYTSDQNILDGTHKDPRRARAAAMSMIPTSTGAAKALGLVLPELKGKLDGFAVRVPTPDVSMVDLTVKLEKQASVEAINTAMKKASEEHLAGVLAYEEEELVSIDFMGNPHSSIFDSKLTNVIGDQAKIVTWYDNEVGFSNRVLDLANYIGQRL
jgi:glyceraldehyde-3-phosphate dehydrogenase type I